jgi:CHAT domain-containing protein/tetratricopeptide (TPR) repeat protein
MGHYAAALPLFRRALEIYRTVVGDTHPDYAVSLENLAVLHRELGDHAAALPLYHQVLETRRTSLGKGNPAYAASLNNLAMLYQDIGDYTAALRFFRQALDILAQRGCALTHDKQWSYDQPIIRRVTLGEIHFPDYGPDSATTLHNLRQYLVDRAISTNNLDGLYLDIVCGQVHHPDYAISLNNLAALYRDMDDRAAAIPLFREALEIWRTLLGENHPHYATSLRGLAVLYHDMGDHAAALPLFCQTLEIWRTALGENHPEYASSLNNLAVLYAATGRSSEAMHLMEQATAIDDRTIGQVLAISSERQRAAFLNTVLGKLYGFFSLVQQHHGDSPAAVRAVLDLVLRRKAIAAEVLAIQRDAVLRGRYRALEPKLRELASLRMHIAREALAGPRPEGLESHLRVLADWNARRERLETELARQIPEMNLEQKLRAADHRAVALNLTEGVVLVEFVRFFGFNFQAVPARGDPYWKSARYIAFVLPGGAPDEVQMIDLGEAELIDRMIADFRAGVIAEAATGGGRDMARWRDEAPATVENDTGSVLRAALFDRLTPALGDRTRLLIAPDGDLARLPLEVLPTADGRRLIDDYQISYLSCGRDVLRFGSVATGEPGGPLVVADPDFDLEAEERLAPDLELAIPSIGRHSRDLDRDHSAHHFHRLPGTQAEGERVATRLGVSPWLDATALEGRLKTACHSPRILHLATHGFFLPDQPRDLNRDGRGLGFDFGEFFGARGGRTRLSRTLMENPMLRSGLALAGANTWLKAGNLPEEAEDGLLTAEDVTGLDLLATELVVLSACETGLGRVHVGEGVFGLRRAFVLAGAKTLVMSLWKVPDEPTRELMEDFYDRLLAGEGRAEALRQAQLAMKAKYPDPFYWGAFICQGDPSPLGMVRPGIAGTGVATDHQGVASLHTG